MTYEYVLCDDWFIFARGSDDLLYQMNTEMWIEWIDLPNAHGTREWMLPYVLRHWDTLTGRLVLCDELTQSELSYL